MAIGYDGSFADTLAAEPAPLQVAVPPVMPKLTGLQRFGDVLAGLAGAKIDREGSFQKGVEARSQFGLRSAQTESALAEADKRRNEALRQSQINELVTRAQANPNFQPTVTDLLTLSTGANDFSNARLGSQQFDNRAILGDQNAAPVAQFAAGQGVQGHVLPQIQPLGPGREIDLLTQQPHTNPIGEAQIANYQEKPVGGFTLGGVRYDATGKPIVDVPTAAANAATVAGAVADAKAAPTTVKLPPKVRQAKAENNATLANIDAAIALVEQYPDSFGLKFGLGDTVNQRLDPDGVAARAAVANIGSAKIHERTGATMAAKEAPRLTPFIPATTDRSEAILTKLNGLRDQIMEEQNAMESAYAQQAPVAAPGAPVGGAAAPLRQTSKSGKPIISHDGGATWEYE